MHCLKLFYCFISNPKIRITSLFLKIAQFSLVPFQTYCFIPRHVQMFMFYYFKVQTNELKWETNYMIVHAFKNAKLQH